MNSYRAALLITMILVSTCLVGQQSKILGEVKSAQGYQNNKGIPNSFGLDGVDGPYIVNDTLYRVSADNTFIMERGFRKDSLVVRANNASEDEFYLSLNSNYEIPESNYAMPEKLVVFSDIEGNFNAFSSFLQAHKIIDENFNWIFGGHHLVLLGDIVDRGQNVTQTLWLIYKLEQQASLVGGKVHFILGNHEIMNFHGDYRYNRSKYIKVAQKISGEEDRATALKYLYSGHTELGKWMATKNVIEKIGNYTFVHAGLSPELLDYKLSLEEINNRVRSRFHYENTIKDTVTDFLYSARGPFWFRGLVLDKLPHNAIKGVDLKRILSYYNAKKIVVGHTLVEEISTGYQGKVIMMDVPHGSEKFSGKTKGLLIEGKNEYVLDDLGNKKKLKG